MVRPVVRRRCMTLKSHCISEMVSNVAIFQVGLHTIRKGRGFFNTTE